MTGVMNYHINNSVFDQFPELESERLRFRSFELSDARDFMKLRSDPTVMEFVDSVYITSETQALEKIRNLLNDFTDRNGINWVITDKSTNQFMGYIGFWRLMKEHVRAEIGYALAPEFWSKGYMYEAAMTILNFGFQNFTLHSVEANVNIDNQRSITLLKKLGFVKEAHFRENYLFKCKFLDSIIFSLLESDFNRQLNE